LKLLALNPSLATLDIIEHVIQVVLFSGGRPAGLDKPMEEELGVPVLDGVVCAVKMAEAAFDYNLKHSKMKAFKRPEPKEFVEMERFVVH